MYEPKLVKLQSTKNEQIIIDHNQDKEDEEENECKMFSKSF